MNEIYWITRLDLISGWLLAFTVVSGVIAFISSCLYIGNRSEHEDHGWESSKNWMNFCAKTFRSSTFCFFLFLISSILTPTTKEAVLIYGVGNTIDYVKQNNTLQQIPDKCINALDAWVDSLTEKESKNEN